MKPRSEWILIHPEFESIGLARPELEQVKGGGWILYIWDDVENTLACIYFGGNLISYKDSGWQLVGKL